jgi:hypothetical protein
MQLTSLRNLRAVLAAWLLVVLLAACSPATVSTGESGGTLPPGTVTVDIAYLNHPPVRPVLDEVNKLLDSYGPKVSVQRYDFDTPEGAAFAQTHNLTEHVPIAILVNGSMDAKVNGRDVKFYSFPQGQGAGTGMVLDGAWTLDDLRAVLDQLVTR